MNEKVQVEITYEDGSVAMWVLDADDPRIDRVEMLLGTPDTHAL